MSQIYLDYAAATPIDPLVLKAMEPYFSEKFYNPSATYLAARALRSDIDDIRRQIGAQLGAKPAEIVFTAGATEANNLAIQGIMRQFPAAPYYLTS
jgi:cysteine desulfurase